MIGDKTGHSGRDIASLGPARPPLVFMRSGVSTAAQFDRVFASAARLIAAKRVLPAG